MSRTASAVDRHTRIQRSWFASIAALGVVAFAGDAHAQVAFRTVAASGDPAPGIDGGKLTFPQVATISAAGHVAFTSELEDSAGSGYISIWVSDATGLHLVARNGPVMPGGPSFDSLHGFVYQPLPVQTDWLPFRGTQDGVVGLFARDGVELRPLVRTGDTIGARTVGTLKEFVASNGQGDTLAVDDGGAVFHVARDGTRTLLVDRTTECGGPAGAVCSTLMPLISDAGHVFTPTAPEGGERQLRFGMPGALAVLAQVGQSVPGLGPAEKWGIFQRVGLGKDGSLVLAASVGNDDTLESWSGIWTKSPNGELTLVDKLPLTLGGSTLHRIERVHVAGASEYVFTGYDDTDPPNPRELIVARRAGRFELVAKATDPAPGASPARFREFFGGAYVNAKGEVLFHARLEADDGSIGQRNDSGLWIVRPPSTTPELLVRAGAPLDLGGGRGVVTPDDVGIVPMFETAGGGTGTPFNDAGQVVFEIGYPTISDAVVGTAVLVSGEPASPEVGRPDLALVVERLDDSVLHPRAPNERALPLRIRVKNQGTDLAASVRLSFVRKTEPGAPLVVASPVSNAQTPPPVWLCGSEPGGAGALHECRGAALRPNEELVGEVFLETDAGTVTIKADVPGEEDPTPADNSFDLHLFDRQSALQRDKEGGSCGCSTPGRRGTMGPVLLVLPAVAALAWRRRRKTG